MVELTAMSLRLFGGLLFESDPELCFVALALELLLVQLFRRGVASAAVVLLLLLLLLLIP